MEADELKRRTNSEWPRIRPPELITSGIGKRLNIFRLWLGVLYAIVLSHLIRDVACQ